jgi:hypothetical protein
MIKAQECSRPLQENRKEVAQTETLPKHCCRANHREDSSAIDTNIGRSQPYLKE